MDREPDARGEAALDVWAGAQSDEAIRERAVAAYACYQKCSLAAARRLFATGS